ncbi:putative UPF0481 protein [Camellia lanceoleosa]|uniref:UPF0481 protein n=1 Tax=Camellia lanceoleosa TaxID=1840588 RepID=A0ACC0FQ81_9ERIC|nr:putative UPF0481 protein [Camellia lanceoleosa]
MLRKTKNYQNNYAPRVVSVGPYHHDHNNLKLQRMQELKRRITSKLVSDDQQLLEDLYERLFQKVKQLRDCYEEKSTDEYNDDEFIRMMLVDGCKHVELCVSNRYTFRNVEELIDVGIHVKKNKKSSYLTDINFSSFCNFGRLELPTITVDDSTEAKFLNLIAYEMCGDTPNNLWVTSYICFLDSLIGNPNDVKELRSAHILQNCLGSDVKVTTLFNKIGKDLVPHPSAYASVKKEIQSHYDNRGNAFIA